MTQVFGEDGRVYPATVLAAAPNTVTQVKTVDRDGYAAVQVACGARKEKNVNKAQRSKGLFGHFREYRAGNGEMLTLDPGAQVRVGDAFTPGDVVAVSSVSKAKGFQGVVKRHGFSGGPRTHGQKHNERAPGSIGGGLRRRVPKGMRMAGRTGGTLTTVKNLTVVRVDTDKDLLYVRGAVPGRRGTLVEVRGVA